MRKSLMNINDISRKGLTHKMLKLVVVHLFIIIIVVFLTMYYFLSSSFKALEESYVDEKVDLAIGAFNDQVKYLETLTFDWAIWDDSYEYIQGNDAGFERRNLSDAAIENLEVDLMAYLDENMSHLFIAFNQDYPINFSHFEDLIDRMEKNHLVMRVKDPNDRRVVRIHLLEEGERIIEEVIQKRQNYLSEVLGDFSKEEILATWKNYGIDLEK